jgi:hypothetical protein
MGTVPNARPTVNNYSYLSNNATARAGMCLGWHGLLSPYYKGFVALPLEVLTFLPCQRCSWCAKEFGVGSSGEYKSQQLNIVVIFCSSQRLTIR